MSEQQLMVLELVGGSAEDASAALWLDLDPGHRACEWMALVAQGKIEVFLSDSGATLVGEPTQWDGEDFGDGNDVIAADVEKRAIRSTSWARRYIDAHLPDGWTHDGPLPMLQVRIMECRGHGPVWESRHRTRDTAEALRRAVRKHWGRSAHFVENRELTRGHKTHWYGQIGKPCSTGGTNLITPRVHVEFSERW